MKQITADHPSPEAYEIVDRAGAFALWDEVLRATTLPTVDRVRRRLRAIQDTRFLRSLPYGAMVKLPRSTPLQRALVLLAIQGRK